MQYGIIIKYIYIPVNSFGFASLNRTLHLSPHENICNIALITIHYLNTIIVYGTAASEYKHRDTDSIGTGLASIE